MRCHTLSETELVLWRLRFLLQTVGQLLKEHNAEVTGFIRFEVGEGIEKVETDFAAEVAAMSKQS